MDLVKYAAYAPLALLGLGIGYLIYANLKNPDSPGQSASELERKVTDKASDAVKAAGTEASPQDSSCLSQKTR